MGLFSCKACPVHTEHVATLRAEVESLRKLVHMPVATPTIEAREVDRLFSGTQDAVQDPQVGSHEQDAQQAAAIFTGMHEDLSL